MPPTNGKRTHQAKKRSWATHINVLMIAFALLAPSAAVLWGKPGALSGFAATALTIVAAMKLFSFMHHHASLACGPVTAPHAPVLCLHHECLMLLCILEPVLCC